MHIFTVTALALFALATCQVQGDAPGAAQAASSPGLRLGGGPVDTGGFLLYTPPAAGQPRRLVGAYWRQRELDSNGSILRENVRRWTLRDVEGLDQSKVTKFNVVDPVLSESGGPYTLEAVAKGTTVNDVLNAVAEVAGVRPAEEKSDARFAFWGFTCELDKPPAAIVSGGR